MTKGTALLAALLLSGPALAQTDACLTRPQMDAMMAHMLPSALDGLTRRCAAVLPDGAFLRQEGGALAQRYRQEVTVPWDAARAGMARMTENVIGTGLLSEQVERQMMVEIVQGLIEKEVPTRDCARADAVIAQLAPLPIDNLGRLLTLIVGITDKEQKPPFRLCTGEVPAR